MEMESIYCYLKSCTRCGGDLIFDEGDLRCWQCGHYYYTRGAISAEHSRPDPLVEYSPPEVRYNEPTADGRGRQVDSSERRRRTAYGARAARNINAVIRPKQASDQRWWSRNRYVIECLDRGLSVREVAHLAGRGERQIRVIRERLTDLRSVDDAGVVTDNG